MVNGVPVNEYMHAAMANPALVRGLAAESFAGLQVGRNNILGSAQVQTQCLTTTMTDQQLLAVAPIVESYLQEKVWVKATFQETVGTFIASHLEQIPTGSTSEQIESAAIDAIVAQVSNSASKLLEGIGATAACGMERTAMPNTSSIVNRALPAPLRPRSDRSRRCARSDAEARCPGAARGEPARVVRPCGCRRRRRSA